MTMKTNWIAFLALTTAASLQARTWTSTAGTTIEGELIDYANLTAIIQAEDGRRLPVQLELLSPSDKEYVREWYTAKKQGSSLPKGKAGKELSPELAKLLPEKLIDSNGKEVSRDELAGKTVGFYFSAHWCPPCKAFTPSLVKFRDANKEDFEVVFVSSDRNPAAQMSYMKEMDMKWFTIKHRSKEANALAQKYGVRGIPALIIVDADGKMITKNGRGDVSSNPNGALAAWGKR
jgi:nucleoredoxin